MSTDTPSILVTIRTNIVVLSEGDSLGADSSAFFLAFLQLIHAHHRRSSWYAVNSEQA
jgi:hypothetical protein